jgi:hypothetical protein
MSYYILKVLSWVGLVWDLRVPSLKVLNASRVSRPPIAEPALVSEVV